MVRISRAIRFLYLLFVFLVAGSDAVPLDSSSEVSFCTFKIMDDDESRSLDAKEFRKGIHDYGLTEMDQETIDELFTIFDKDGSGTVSLAEFIETMHQFSGQGEDEKISFLFKVYDLNGEYSVFLDNLAFLAIQFPQFAITQKFSSKLLECFG